VKQEIESKAAEYEENKRAMLEAESRAATAIRTWEGAERDIKR
jgi:hypothetical protein